MGNEAIRYNNQTMVLYSVIVVLKYCGKQDMLRASILVTLLQDERIVSLLKESGEDVSFANLRILNRGMMANINKRYYHTLPLFVNAVSMLLDAQVVTLSNGEIQLKSKDSCDCFPEIGNVDSVTANRVNSVAPYILRMCEDVTTKRMIQSLNVEI